MRNVKMWLMTAFVLTALATGVVLMSHSSSQAAPEPAKDHWQHHDGHWSYWHEGDKRWYYTDGAHWYYNDNNAWTLYPFDKGFGREGFEHGEYKVPGPGVKVVVPHHQVYHK